MFLNTFAIVHRLPGKTAMAVESQEHASSLKPSTDADSELHDRLAEYVAALKAQSDDDGR